jgi:hypothetical protein
MSSSYPAIHACPACPAIHTKTHTQVLDGVDGFILGAETFRGKYPVLTVSTISKICRCERGWTGIWKCGEAGVL